LLTNLVRVVDWKVEIVNDRGQSFGGALSHANVLVADEPDQYFQKSFLKIKPIESLTDVNKQDEFRNLYYIIIILLC
jgi:hypothetical protein